MWNKKGVGVYVVEVLVLGLVAQGAGGALTVIRKPALAISVGSWTYEDPAHGSNYGQYVYSSPMGKTCLNNLTIHMASWICGTLVVPREYLESRLCIPDMYDMPAAVVDMINSNSTMLKDTCVQLSAYHYDYYGRQPEAFSQEAIDITWRGPTKLGLAAIIHSEQATAMARSSTTAGIPLIQGKYSSFQFDFSSYTRDIDGERVSLFFRVLTDLSGILPGMMELLPDRFAVIFDAETAAEAGPSIRTQADRKNKSYVEFIVPSHSNSIPEMSDEALERVVDSIVSSSHRYVLLATSPYYAYSNFACKLWVKGVHEHVTVVTLYNYPFYAVFNAPHDPRCSLATNQIVVDAGGWIGAYYETPFFPDVDFRIMKASGFPAVRNGSYGLDGSPWVDNGLNVTASSTCKDHDDDANNLVMKSAATRRFLLSSTRGNGREGERVKCADVVTFGQNRMMPWISEIASLCPISACRYNSRSAACRISCACTDTVTEIYGKKLCTSLEQLAQSDRYDGIASNEYRCEGGGCRVLPYAASGLHFLSQYESYVFSADSGLCEGQYRTGVPNHTGRTNKCSPFAFAAFRKEIMPSISDGVYSHAMAFKCVEDQFGIEGLRRLANYDYKDTWVTKQLTSCLANHVSFQGLMGAVSYKEENKFSIPVEGGLNALYQTGHVHGQKYFVSGFIDEKGPYIGSWTIKKRAGENCTKWTSNIAPGFTCPGPNGGEQVQYRLGDDPNILPLSGPMSCDPGNFPVAINDPVAHKGLRLDSCAACPRGTYKAEVGTERCSPCREGWYASTRGSTACEACPPDTFPVSPADPIALFAGGQQWFGAETCASCPGGPHPWCIECTSVLGLEYLVIDHDSSACVLAPFVLGCFIASCIATTWALFCLFVHCRIVIPIADVSLQKNSCGNSLVLQTSRRHNWCHYGRPWFHVVISGTNHELLDRPQGFHARVHTKSKIILLDDAGNEICERADTSQGLVRMKSICGDYFNTYWLRPFPLATTIPVLAIVAAVSIHGGGFQGRGMAGVVVSASAVLAAASSFYKRRRWAAPAPLSKRLEEFREIIRGKVIPCEMGPDRAIQVAKLLDLHTFFASFIEHRNAYYLEKNIIHPLTCEAKISYSELVGPSRLMWFVSHYWGTSFTHFCDAVSHHAQRTKLSEDNVAGSWEDTSYWICFISNNQYDIDKELGHGHWNESSFYLALVSGSTRGTCLVLDDQALPLTRSWCIFELLQTIKLSEKGSYFGSFAGGGLLLCTATGCMNLGDGSIDVAIAVVDKVATLDLGNARATNEQDQEMIQTLVVQQMGSFAEMNAYVRREMLEIFRGIRSRTDSQFDSIFDHLLETIASVAEAKRGSELSDVANRHECADSPLHNAAI
eukprot:TRINITY_DN37860_c0_g1_i1.p1 TRINITY_DN37860_c0_g1~~TRINITY_DN37860_c0_g1_i1.p1  ORF type:complete len:1368 (-),score=103.09 TRINITY_DN37860_c0_g1_i1:269-4372(-)